MIKINLIPKEQLDKIEKKLLIAKVSLISFFIIIFFTALSMWQVGRAKALDIEFLRKNAEYEKLKPEIKKNEEIRAQMAEVNNYINAINKITKNKFIYIVFMQDLVNNLPTTMWFSGINTRTTGDSLEVNINVLSNSLYDMAWWLSFIENSKRFSSPNIGNITVSDQGDISVYSAPFTFKYTYN